MRKATLLLMGLIVGIGTVQAQAILPTEAWRIPGGAESWFPASGDVVRGGAYNPATGHLLVVSRAGGTNVIVVDAATGDSLAALDMTGVATSNGFFKLTEVGTTTDGQIFGVGLFLNNTNNIQIFRWADESATPTIVFDGPLAAGRWGDGFGVGGSGNSARLYLSGSGNDQIAVFDYNGTAAVLRGTYLQPEAGTDRARYGLAEVPGQDSLWINEPGSAIAKISLTTGQIGREIAEGVVPVGFGDLTYFERMGRQYLGTGVRFGGTPSEYFAVVDVTDRGAERIVFITPSLGTTPNGNAAGFVAYDSANDRLLVGATNNGIAAYGLTGFTAFDTMLRGFHETNPVATSATGNATVALAGDTLTVRGAFSNLSAAFTGAHIHVGAFAANGPVVIGLSPTLNSAQTLGTFNTVIDLSTSPPMGISVADFKAALADGRLYVNVHSQQHPGGEIRGQLLAQSNAAPTAPEIASPANMSTVTLSGRTDANVMASWTAATDADGNAISYVWQLATDQALSAANTVSLQRSAGTSVAINTVGALYRMLSDQYGAVAGDSILFYHRAGASDGAATTFGSTAQVYLKLGMLEIEDAAWRIGTDATAFFNADNNTRGGAYNPTTGHVVVATRSGGLKLVLIDAATGDSVGVMSTAGIAGGTFPLSEISITEDGQIFGANLTVSPSASAVKVYRWADAFSAPTLVFESTALEGPRYGDSFAAVGTGSGVSLFLTGSGNDRIAVLRETTPGTFDLDDYVIPEAGEPRGRGGIAGSASADSIWVKSPTHQLAKVSLSGGGIREIPESVVGIGYSDLAFTQAVYSQASVMTTREYLLTGVRFQGAENFALVDVTTPGMEMVIGVTDTLGTAANGNATGFASFDVRNNRIIVASTNNAIASFNAPVTVTDADVISNEIPTAPSITSPADGAAIALEGGANQAFTATWGGASDDGGTLSYRWQLSTTANFAGNIVLDVETAENTEFTTTFADVDDLLASVGVLPGMSTMLYQRVVATDGTNYAASDIKSVTITRGVLVGVDEPAAGLPRSFQLYSNMPNPVGTSTVLRFDLPTQADVTVRVYDSMGREVMKQAAAFGAGAKQALTLDASSLAAGVYLYRVEAVGTSGTEVKNGRFAVLR